MSEYDEIAKGIVYAYLVDRVRFVKDADEQMEQRIATALTAAVAAEREKWEAEVSMLRREVSRESNLLGKIRGTLNEHEDYLQRNRVFDEHARKQAAHTASSPSPPTRG